MNIKYEIIRFFSKLFGLGKVKSRPAQVSGKHTGFHDFTITLIDGSERSLETYRGKKVLVVNVASKCGFTPQYDALEGFYRQYGDRVEVIGFPANDFAAQEPGSEEDIAAFCRKNYGVSFPLSGKISVTGESKHLLYQWLTDPEQNGWNNSEPSWNFSKYLIDEEGALTHFFAPAVSPFSNKLLKAAGITNQAKKVA